MPLEFFPHRGSNLESRLQRLEMWAAQTGIRNPSQPGAALSTAGGPVTAGSGGGAAGGGGGSALGGDVQGSAGNNRVAALQGTTLQLLTPAAGDLLTSDGTKLVNQPWVAGPFAVGAAPASSPRFGFLTTGELQLSGTSGTAGTVLTSGGTGAAVTWTAPASQGQMSFTAPPLAAAFTPVNVTTGTLADSALEGLFVNAPDIAAGTGQFWVKAVAAGAYTWIVRLDMLLLGVTFNAAGLALRDSAGGKIITFEQFIFGASGLVLSVEHWNDANTRTANPYASGDVRQLFPWMRVVDDGTTNRTYAVSRNGADWITVFSEARAGFLGVAPNQVGLFACANGAATGLNVFSWTGV